jgi:chromate transporter
MLLFVLSVLVVVFVTFGGGAVFIPMFEDMFVYRMEIFTLEEYTNIIAILNAFPGPTGGKIAGYTGFVEYGVIGFTLASLAFVLPGTIMMLVSYNLVEKVKGSKLFKQLNLYIKPIIIGIFLSIVLKFSITSFNNIGYIETIVITVVSFILLDRYKLSPLKVIGLAITYGLITYFIL